MRNDRESAHNLEEKSNGETQRARRKRGEEQQKGRAEARPLHNRDITKEKGVRGDALK